MLPASLLQQLPDGVFGKSRITRFNGEEKPVISHTAEAVPIEHWMIPPRQAVHSLPGKKCGECGEKHRQLKHDREKGRNGEEIPRLPVYIERVKNRRRTKFN